MQKHSALIQLLVLLAETVLLIGLALLNPVAMLLGFVLSAHAMVLLPRRQGILWIFFQVLLTGGLSIYHSGWINGLLLTLAYTAGYISFGFAYYSRDQATTALAHSKALLTELQDAHRQLQTYTNQIEALTVEQERSRLAREMHDTLGHRLSITAVQLEGAQRLIPDQPTYAAQMIETVREQVREALLDLRRVVTTLRTPPEADLPLPQALSRLVERARQPQLHVHLALPEHLAPLPYTHCLALYRVAQEALTNVQRHAHAQDVWIDLETDDKTVALNVSDNGVGFDPEEKHAGFGILGMRERAVQLGGNLVIQPRPEGGTRLAFCLPLPTEVAHA